MDSEQDGNWDKLCPPQPSQHAGTCPQLCRTLGARGQCSALGQPDSILGSGAGGGGRELGLATRPHSQHLAECSGGRGAGADIEAPAPPESRRLGCSLCLVLALGHFNRAVPCAGEWAADLSYWTAIAQAFSSFTQSFQSLWSVLFVWGHTQPCSVVPPGKAPGPSGKLGTAQGPPCCLWPRL